MSRSSYRTSA